MAHLYQLVKPFLLSLITLLQLINHTSALYTIKARHWIVRTRNFQTARLEWTFNFGQTQMSFMDIRMTNHRGKENKVALLRNNRWIPYDEMRDRLVIRRTPNRNGIIIEIPNVVISDGGDYTCKAISQRGEVYNVSKLVVVVPPRIDKRVTRMYRDEGQNASILCNLEAGNPKPLRFRWYRVWGTHSHEMRSLTPIKLRDYNLTWYIANVDRESMGKYRCNVDNGYQEVDERLIEVDSHVVDLFVRYKPVVTSRFLNISVLEEFGSRIFRCYLEGNAGRMTYHWYRKKPFPQFEIRENDKDMLISRDRSTLTFTRPKRILAGDYYCAGENDLGIGRPRAAYLNVTYKPGDIEMSPVPDESQSVNVMEGKNLTVNCYSDANPAAHYNWYKKVKTLWGTTVREYVVKYSLNGELRLPKADRNDTSNYVCEAMNRPIYEDSSRVFKTKREISVKVNYGPLQTNFSINDYNYTYVEVKRYSRVIIRCESHSEPTPNYYIRTDKAKTQLNKDPKKGLVVIESITVEDEGMFICTSHNLMTDQSEVKRIRVVVAIPPQRRDPVPDSKTPTEGATLSIDCWGLGRPPPTVFWQRWGANITHNDSVIQTYYRIYPIKEGPKKLLTKVQAKLKFTGIRWTDDASYSCVLNNSAGIYNVTNIRYQVQYSPKLTQWPANITTRVGKKVIFSCQAFGKPEGVQWRWYHNDVLLKRELLHKYTIEYATAEDNGRYTCEPWNSVGSTQRGTGILQVQYEPRFIKKPELNYTLDATETLRIECDAVAVPPPEIYWVKFGSSTFRQDGGVLILASLKPEDRGKYTCIAKNVVASKSAPTTIIIRHRPVITTNTPADTMIGSADGHPVSLKCDVDAYPAAVVQWKDKVNDKVIDHGRDYKIVEERSPFSITSTLKFTVHSYQLGKKYVCYARNEYGWKSQDFQVLVEGKPDPPEPNSLKAIDYLMPTVPVTVNINFTWIPGYNGGADVDYYLLYKEKKESRFHEHHMTDRVGFKYVFENKKAGASYVFSMRARNKFGVSRIYEPSLYLETKDAPPNAANVSIERIGSDGKSVRIFWSIGNTERVKREIDNKWKYAIIRYKFADFDNEWIEKIIPNIPLKGTFVIGHLEPEQLYVFHFILYDELDNFARPILIGKFYPRYGHSLPSSSALSKTDIIIIGVACGGLILLIAMIILIIAVCKKRKKLSGYGVTSYSNGHKMGSVPKTTTGYSDEVVRSSYFKVEDADDDEDPLVQDSASGLESTDKSPPPAYNAVHYNVRATTENKNPTSSFSDTSHHTTTTFDQHPPYRAPKGGITQPLLPPIKHESDEEIKKRLSSDDDDDDEDVPEPPCVPPSDESDMNNRYPTRGRQSPNASSVASSKPYRSDNEYIEEADEDYVGFLV